jgi:hypothetical protein
MSEPKILTGNAQKDGTEDGGTGWFIGHKQKEFPRQQEAASVKWSSHLKGEHRVSAHEIDERVMTVSVLIKGSFRVRFDEQEILLQNEGDYVLYTHNLSHESDALEDSTILTVRWPSV